MRILLVAAVALVDPDGRVLIAKRPEGKELAGLWEFPGGKVERGEVPSAALARELEEELGIQARVGREIVRFSHAYPKRATILLIFFKVNDFSGEPQSLAFERIEWVVPDKLPAYDFLDGDVDFVRRLAAGEYR